MMEKRITIEELELCTTEQYDIIIETLESLPVTYRIWEEPEE
jgi:hypothetical protein